MKKNLLKDKVFGVGLGKTGTSTLGICLEILGYHVKGCDAELTRQFRQNNWLPIYSIVEHYDGFEDFPWPLIYKEMDNRYPQSKFILTTRKDSKTWYRSLCKHADRTGPTEHKQLAYGYKMPHELEN